MISRTSRCVENGAKASDRGCTENERLTIIATASQKPGSSGYGRGRKRKLPSGLDTLLLNCRLDGEAYGDKPSTNAGVLARVFRVFVPQSKVQLFLDGHAQRFQSFEFLAEFFGNFAQFFGGVNDGRCQQDDGFRSLGAFAGLTE